MKRFMAVLLTLLLAAAIPTGAAAEAEDVQYTATVTKKMTIRATKSTSGKKLGSVEENETIQIIEFGGDWTRVTKDGVTGYVLSKNVVGLAAAGPYDDLADAVFTGVSAKELTVRAEKSKSALRMQTLAEGETVYILELGETWDYVVKNGVRGYALADSILGVTPAHEGVALPEGFEQLLPFEAVYSAQADVNLSIRKEKDADSRLLGTVYENEEVDVMETDGEWARVKKGDADGYVLADHLRYYKRYDPFGPFVPGTVYYPYAAVALEDTQIFDAQTGAPLRTVPAGVVMAVSALDAQMSVTLPYDRITGRIQATGSLDMQSVVPWDAAQPGDLIAVFSTYYDPQMGSQIQIGRQFNIGLAVQRVDGAVVPSGGLFRFNDYCAPYTKANGYELGPIINYVSDDKLGYGGGTCQVSTTLYNAILQIPIKVVKWQVHSSYGISYVPLDFDAAVGAGNLDLRLENPLPYDVRFALQAQGGVVTARVYRAS